MNARLILITIGILAIAATYLPSPYDNITYVLLVIFVIFGFYTRNKLKTNTSFSNHKIIFNALGVTIAFLIVLLGSFIYLVKSDPNFDPKDLTPFMKSIYNLVK